MGVAGFVAVALILSSSSSWAANPGFRIVITSNGLNYVLKVGIPILEEALSKANIPDINGKAGTPIGDVKYSLSNIKLGKLSIPTSSLTSGSSGLTLSASGISISGTADWSYDHSSFPHISDHGSADVSVSSTSLSLVAALGADSKGHFTLSASQCSINIGHLDVKFHGGASWLYNLFASNIADSFKGSMQDQLCKAAKDEINNVGNKEAESFPIEVKIDNYALANYALLGPPAFTSSYIETNHKGEFQSVTNPVESSLTPSALPDPSSSDRMLYVWFTDYVANTAGAVYQAAGALKYKLTPDKVPANFPIKLNTNTFQDLIPVLYKTYPNMSMVLDLAASKPPTMEINTQTVNLTVPTYVNASVITSNNTKAVFTLQMVIYMDVKVGIGVSASKEMLTGNATFLKTDISLVSSTIGQFDVTVLQKFSNTLSQQLVIPLVNGYLNKGIEIPTFSGVSFVNSAISLGDHYVMVSTDVNYKPLLVREYQVNINEL